MEAHDKDFGSSSNTGSLIADFCCCITPIIGMHAVNTYLITDNCFPSTSRYIGLSGVEFTNALVYQISTYLYPRAHAFGSYIPREGEEPLQWFGRVISCRFQPVASPTGSDVSMLSTPSSVNTDSNSVVKEKITVGNTTLEEGWLLATAVATVPQAIYGTLELPCDITAVHKQVKIKKTGNAKQTQVCRICSKNKSKGVTQKKPPFLCINCGDFFCHAIESSKAGSEPRCCFWLTCVKIPEYWICTQYMDHFVRSME